MAKLTTNTISAGFQSNDALNANFALIEDFSDTVLSLDGTLPNTMSADINMGGNDLLQVGDITCTTISATNLTIPGSLTTLPSIESGDALKVLQVNAGETGVAWTGEVAATNKVMVASGDDVPNYLSEKVADGDGITTSILNLGGNEDLEIAVNITADKGLQFNSGALECEAGTGITLTSAGINVDVGTTDGKIVQMTTGDKLPAVDGSNLTNIAVPAGEVSFYAYRKDSILTNQTGNGTEKTVVFNLEDFDTGSGYDSGTGIWTCPAGKDGVYFFSTCILLGPIVSSAATIRISHKRSSTVQLEAIGNAGNATGYNRMYANGIFNCTAGDTVEVIVYALGEGSDNLSINAYSLSDGSAGGHVRFQGYKVS